MSRTLRTAIATALLALLCLTGTAAAQQPQYVPCPGGPEGARCGRVPVALDRTGAVPGTIDLLVARLATRGPERGTVIVLAGGPGQAAVPTLGVAAEALRPALRGRELVVFDQRGTGASGRLRCAALEGGEATGLSGAVAACGRQLGPRRALFTTRQSVDDLEAVRQAVGAPRVSLVGVSYGTKLAAAYAARYPAAVERLVLDSVVPVEGPDPFARASLRAVPAVLRDLCAGGACRRATPDPARDVAALAARLREAPIRATAYGPDGRPVRVTVTEAALAAVVQRGDLDLVTRARTPGAIRSALLGDGAPLARLLVGGGGGGDGVGPALFVTTTCQEAPTPWRRGSSAEARVAEARAAAAALTPAELGVFGPDAAGGVSPQLTFCRLWPEAAEPEPLAPGAAPDVPVLAVAGAGDVRTPVEDARAVTARYARGQLLVVPRAGHSVLTRGLPCVRRALGAFFGDRPVGACRDEDRGIVTARDPRRLSAVAPVPGTPGRAGRVAKAAVLTITDVGLTGLGGGTAPTAGFQAPRPPQRIRGGGLRGGRFVFSEAGLRLDRVVYVPGVRVSGALGAVDGELGGRLRVRAAGASGVLLVRPGGALTGTIGGRPVRTELGGTPSPNA